MQSEVLFEAALGAASPWFVRETVFDGDTRILAIRADFRADSCFEHADKPRLHAVHDTQVKRYRHLSFFQHECFLKVRVPRAKLSDGAMRLVDPSWTSQWSAFTLLYVALVLSLCREMPFAAVA